MNKKVLIITYYFPPKEVSASRRLYGLTKYLSKLGWEPVILTPKMAGRNLSEFNVIETEYPGSLDELISFAFSGKFMHNRFLWDILAYPDACRNWKKRAVKKASEYLKNNKVDAIISSFGPPTTLLIGAELKEKYKIPWVVDMRDLWTQYYVYEFSRFRRFIDSILERKLLLKADAITTVSAPLAEIQSRFLDGKKIDVVENGFDPEDVAKEKEILSKKFSFIHTGTVYNDYQNPEHFYRALSELIEEKLIDKNKVAVEFYGAKSSYLQEKINKYNLSDVIKFCGLISREDAVKKQRQSQILLYFNWENPEIKGIYSGKIFEYLSSRRPILSTGGINNVATDLLDKTEAGTYGIKNESLKEKILKLYNEYISTGEVIYRGKLEEIDKFSYIEMAKKIAVILDRYS